MDFAARPISLRTKFSVAFGPFDLLRPVFWIPAAVPEALLSAARFEVSQERHSVVFQIDAGGRCPDLRALEEQISRRAAAALASRHADRSVAASGLDPAAVAGFRSAGLAELISVQAAVVPAARRVDRSAAATGLGPAAAAGFRSAGLAELISVQAVVVPAARRVDRSVAATGLGLAAAAGLAEQISQPVVVAPVARAVGPFAAVLERAQVVRTIPAAFFRRTRAEQRASV
jgi:hypothetical protein